MRSFSPQSPAPQPRKLRLSRVLLGAGITVILGSGILLVSRTPPGTGQLCRVRAADAPAGLQPAGTQEWAPPSRDEIEKARWVRRPCVHFLDHLRRAVESEPRLATEEEALSLANEDADSNRKILSVLGRLPSTDAEVDWDATFNRFTGAEPRTLNPLFSSTRYESWLEDLLFVSPVQFDWKFDYHGDLNVIESWETSEDRTMERIVFRKDLLWSDGHPLTAHDVEFTWRLLMDPNVKAVARRGLAEGLRAVKAYDDRTVVYFQKEVLVTNTLHITWGILPRHAFESALKDDPGLERSRLNREPVTCGPYRLVSWAPKQSLVLERRDDWYLNAAKEQIRVRPFFKKVRFVVLPDPSTRFLAFTVGETDDTQLDSAQWTRETSSAAFREKDLKVRGSDEWTYAFIGWNAKSIPPNPFFGDRRVRLAMTLALDHDFLLKQAFFGIYRPGEGIFHPESWMAAKDLKPFHRDAERAEKLLEEAGWTDSDGDGVRDKLVDGKRIALRFVLSCPNAGTGPKVAEQLQTDLKSIGVECDVQLSDFGAFSSALEQHRLQAYLMSMGTGVDPETARSLWRTGAERNQVGYSNPRVDELFDKGRQEFDQEKRARIYAEIDRLIYEDQPVTLLLYQPTLWAFSKSLRGYRPSPKGFYGYAPGFYSIWKKK